MYIAIVLINKILTRNEELAIDDRGTVKNNIEILLLFLDI